MNVQEIYDGSDGEATKALYTRLSTFGAIGEIGTNLFRASKASERAKVYRGGVRGQGSYKSMAYDRKNWAMSNLCTALTTHAVSVELVWGWKEDPAAEYHRWVLYCDLPGIGQVSFHSAARGIGPDYAGEWDGVRGVSADRIVRWCEVILNGGVPPAPPTSTLPAPRWSWCRHCKTWWANRRVCPVHSKTVLEVKAMPSTMPEIRSGVRAEWDDQQESEGGR